MDGALNNQDRLKRIRERIELAGSTDALNREMALEDFRFLLGDQWPAGVRAQRDADQRPCLTSNRLKTFWHQVTNEQRQNRATIRTRCSDRLGRPEVAKIFDAWFRRMIQDCDGEIAFDTGFECATACGVGYWRLYTDYESEESFDQIIGIARIQNPFSVYLDPQAQHPTGMDATWAAISWMVDRDDFRARWPDAAPIPADASAAGDDVGGWIQDDAVRVVEYYEVKLDDRALIRLDTGHVGWEDELAPELAAELTAAPERIVQRREVATRRITCQVVNALEALEEYDIPGASIPIVRCIGDEVTIDGRTVYAGIVRDAKDAQRQYNYWQSAGTELMALAPIATWIIADGQLEGYEEIWKHAHLQNRAYLPYHATTAGGAAIPPPARVPFAEIPAGIQSWMQVATEDLKATTGIRFDASLVERMADESGKAIQELRKSGELGSYHYQDNLRRALVQTGRIALSMFSAVYDADREIAVEYEDGKEEIVLVDPTLGTAYAEAQAANGKIEKRFNPRLGQYDIQVVAGPSYATPRQESAD